MKTQVQGITIAYDDQGTGLPIVFLHAFPLNRSMWSEQVAALSRGFRAIAIDLRGHVEILVDDGLATGSTMRAAVAAVRRQHTDRVILAEPVGGSMWCHRLEQVADEHGCVWTPLYYTAVELGRA